MSAIRPDGYIADIESAAFKKDEQRFWLTAEKYAELALKYRKPQPPAPTHGPGTELKALLKDWLGIEATPTCSCNAMARRMNAEGVAWSLSESGMAEILNVMRAEHGKRWADGRTKLPWTDIGAKTLVRLACRRAEAKASA